MKKPDAFWLLVVPGLFLLGASGIVTNHRNSCSEWHSVVTCDDRDDAVERGAAEARTKGLAGACVAPRNKYFGDTRYTVSLTSTDCDNGAAFVAAEVGR